MGAFGKNRSPESGFGEDRGAPGTRASGAILDMSTGGRERRLFQVP
jgi:hypothetical protein